MRLCTSALIEPSVSMKESTTALICSRRRGRRRRLLPRRVAIATGGHRKGGADDALGRNIPTRGARGSFSFPFYPLYPILFLLRRRARRALPLGETGRKQIIEGEEEVAGTGTGTSSGCRLRSLERNATRVPRRRPWLPMGRSRLSAGGAVYDNTPARGSFQRHKNVNVYIFM